MKLALTEFSLKRPWLVVLLVVMATLFFALQFPKVKFDNDPENMLSQDEYVRVFHHQVKEKYNLYDFVIVGIVNEKDPDGVFNVTTLNRIHDLTAELLSLRQNPDGTLQVTRPAHGQQPARTIDVDLRSSSLWVRVLNKAFNQDPNRLFETDGNSAIIGRELISPSVVDNIKQADLGSLRIEYLMEQPPQTKDQALIIRDDAMNNPLYKGTLVSEDEKAICLYLPITKKSYSYNVASLVRNLTADWGPDDQVYITGLPVAEDTFGTEMLIQMATSAPLAGLAIFLLLLFFFRRLSLIIAPMIVAIVSVVCTMGLLIGLGYDVHIMSSMIAIFLMPIAVADSIHILSEFYDTYHRFGNKAQTVKHVIRHLFMPMLYTSLTTMAGFASLGMTPIPPVQVFGLHVAFGVGLAWVLSMTLIPAYIQLFVSEKRLASLAVANTDQSNSKRAGLLNRFLEQLGLFSYRHWGLILLTTVAIVGVSLYGISRISVNDNPVKWFSPDHDIRVADEVLNRHFGGTYTAYLTFTSPRPDACGCSEKADIMRTAARDRFGDAFPEATQRFVNKVNELEQMTRNVVSCDVRQCLVNLVQESEQIDADALTGWNLLADEINYMQSEGLDYASLAHRVNELEDVPERERQVFLGQMAPFKELTGWPLQEAALQVTDRYTSMSFREFVFEMEAQLTAPPFKRPEVLAYLEGLQEFLAKDDVVGKTSSAVDALKKAAFELNFVQAPADADEEEKGTFAERNRKFFSIPDTPSATGQVFIQLEGMKKKDALFHLVTKDYQEANLWVQLKSGDNKDMEKVVRDVDEYLSTHEPPIPLKAEWAGLTYLNVVWQDKMVKGMMSSLTSSFIVVMIMMMLLFRSVLFGILSMIPLSVTISFIYGLIGLVGKDYDMPVAVLSALTLGLSVDFSIHFLQRAREEQAKLGSWREASKQMFKEPAMAISRNAIVISIGFTPLLLAPLVPYQTVGFFLASIMAVSWLATLFILPALLTMLRRKVFSDDKD